MKSWEGRAEVASPDSIRTIQPLCMEEDNDDGCRNGGRKGMEGKSIKVYEIDAATGIEECPELERGCMELLRDMFWEDIQVQFGLKQLSGNLSMEERIRFEAVLDLFALADYQLVDVTVSDESLQFVVDHCYHKRSLRDSTIEECMGVDRSVKAEGANKAGDMSINSHMPSEAGNEGTGKALEGTKRYNGVSQKQSTKNGPLPGGISNHVEDSNSASIVVKESITHRYRDGRRMSLCPVFVQSVTGPRDSSEHSESQQKTLPIEDQIMGTSRGYLHSRRDEESEHVYDRGTTASTPGAARDRITSIPPSAARKCSSEAAPTDVTISQMTKLQPHLPQRSDTSSSGDDRCDPEDDDGPQRLSRMQRIFASRQLIRHETYAESICSESTDADQQSRLEFDAELGEKLFSKNEEEYTLAASMYEMTGRRYHSRSRACSDLSNQSTKSMVTEVDPELLEWMKKEVLTIKVRRDSHDTASDFSPLEASSRRHSSCFSDQFCNTSDSVQDCPLLDSPQHTFSDAAFAIALRAPGPSRLPTEGARNSLHSRAHSSSFSSSSYMSIRGSTSDMSDVIVEGDESILDPTSIVSDGSVAPEINHGGHSQSKDADVDGPGDPDNVSCAIKGISIGSSGEVPCQLCMTDQHH